MTTAQTAAPPAAALQRCRPHDWRAPEPADRSLTCLTCGRVLDFYTQLTVTIRGAILRSVKHRRAPADAAAFRACLDRYYDEAHEQPKTASMADIQAANSYRPSRSPSRRQRMAERAAQREAAKAASMADIHATTKRSRCTRRRESIAKQVAQRQARRQGEGR